jgi:tryptophan synthase beta chain
VLLAKRLGKQRIIAETGAGQHGYATATVCARYGMPCTIYMGKKDYDRQRPNVFWMEMLGAEVVPVEEGSQTLNDAVIAAFKDLITDPEANYYLLGSAVGPHPYPIMNAWFQRVVGEEARAQILERTGRLPEVCLACLGGGSNASGFFLPFLEDAGVALEGVEAGGRGNAPGDHAARSRGGRHGIFAGYSSYFLQDADGNIAPTHSISAGLDYCGMSPLLAYLHDDGRLGISTANDAPVLQAVQALARTEGLILALESAHALARAMELAPSMQADQILLVNGSGRGEKDLFITMQALQPEALRQFMSDHLTHHSSDPSS